MSTAQRTKKPPTNPTHTYKFTAVFGRANNKGAVKNAQAAEKILRERYSKSLSGLRRSKATLTFLANIADPPLSPLRLYGAAVNWAPVKFSP